MHTKEDIDNLAANFGKCQKILLALGDENRQHMILEMMKMGDCNGVRVNEITEKTHLSRPAVSHLNYRTEARMSRSILRS